VFVFSDEFLQPGDKKKAGESNKGIFRISKTNSPYLDQNKLEAARFRQCVPVGRQNWAGFQKNLIVHQDSRPVVHYC
jgi:hypothetical protein